MQRALRLIFPPQCIGCDAQVETEFSLCATCWRDTPFISGLACDKCGTPLLGDDTGESFESLEVLSYDGRLVISLDNFSGNQLDLSNLDSGVYLLKLSTGKRTRKR